MDKTLNNFIEDYFAEYVDTDLAVGTRTRYRQVWKQYIHPAPIGDLPVDQVDKSAVRDFARERKRSGDSRGSISLQLSIISGGLHFAREDKAIPEDIEDPTEGVLKRLYMLAKKNQKTDVKPFSDDEIDRIIEALRSKDKALYQLLITVGCRIGEALALNWSDVDLVAGEIAITKSFRNGHLSEHTKNRTARSVPIYGALAVDLANIKGSAQENDPVFVGKNGERLTQSSVRYQWSAILKRAGVKYRKLHACRTTCASKALMRNHPPSLVARLLGHDINTLLNSYAKYIDGNGDQLAALVKDLAGDRNMAN